ncbi:4-hydroxybenzoate octaprenyltransferase [Thermoflavifilum thermophilum]|uniref:4-hydroxybenzoate polyprenyltransferase n=1 Tax=Thermoflavifilum thermophilum TaxID=1393122 RepID=A0A1I7NGG1_9BACT|nr:4-hydroxybenzoate octaprenyltransferase [Thermoflavifilum thermophilum]SFV33749.1 4-hydroxybenzoate polyprenyltransferase [Thermoflavifilum thermophilum]
MKTSLLRYLSFVKFSHTIFAMPFALIGFFLAVRWQHYPFSWALFGKVILCMVFARSAAMAFNRILDLEYDRLNPRTAQRELPTGKITYPQAVIFTALNVVLFVCTTYFINPICFYLSPVALAVVLGYSYTKRFTAFSHLVLGLGLSLAPIGAYLAVTGRFHWLPLMYSGVVICWVAGFDIIYSLQDVAFDQSLHLYSMPVWLGKKRALQVSSFLHGLSAVGVIAAGWLAGFGWLYWMGAGWFAFMLWYQHRLVHPDDLSRVNIAFMTTNGIASCVFAVFVILDLFITVS